MNKNISVVLKEVCGFWPSGLKHNKAYNDTVRLFCVVVTLPIYKRHASVTLCFPKVQRSESFNDPMSAVLVIINEMLAQIQ